MDMGLAIFLTSVSVAGIILVITVISFGHAEKIKRMQLRELELKENAYREEFEDEVMNRLDELTNKVEAMEKGASKDQVA